MKVKYIYGDEYYPSLIKDKVYDVVSIRSAFYNIVDESGDWYSFLSGAFEIVDKEGMEELLAADPRNK